MPSTPSSTLNLFGRIWRSLALAASSGVLAGQALASTFNIAPMDLGSGYTLTGYIATDGTIGTLSPANITDWNLHVAAVSDFFYTPSNTRNTSSGLLFSAGQLLVPTSPDGVADGGSLSFFSMPRLGVQVADFTGANVVGGQAYWVAGGSFNAQPLGQADGGHYVAATAVPGSAMYNLTPVRFNSGEVMSGSITATNTNGAVNISDWNIRIRQVTDWNFSRANTAVLSTFGLTSDGQSLAVTPFDVNANPGSFIIAAGRLNLSGVMLADFSSDPTGQAGLLTPSLLQLTNNLPLNVNGDVVVAQAVPEPETWVLLIAGLIVVVDMKRRRTRL